jgi:hypothetical protein
MFVFQRGSLAQTAQMPRGPGEPDGGEGFNPIPRQFLSFNTAPQTIGQGYLHARPAFNNWYAPTTSFYYDDIAGPENEIRSLANTFYSSKSHGPA